MYFKKLELFGFKSFVEKTTLIFEPGVTAIVGPNGTGKSNIADAIKWVLGEQSPKSMRGSKMEDVIFNGTDLQPPLNMTEISLTLSNEGRHLPIDYDEVTITRRLYRSGESEYLLNKTPVRLKDINELLMGTGIGTESYSLLEQGRIDIILSSKPEERRVVFEEASGITRYKTKKDEAMRKLQQTEENLLRLNDIITEVNRQLGSIQRQVNKARRYQEEFERLKLMETQFVYRQHDILKSKQQQFKEQEESYKNEVTALENELAKLKQAFGGLKDVLAEVDNEYSQLNNKMTIASTTIEKNEHRISLDKERTFEFKGRVEKLCSDIENTKKRISELEEQHSKLTERLDVFESEKSKKAETLSERETSIAEIEKKIKEALVEVEQNKTSAVNMLAEQAHLKNELAKLAANIQNANARLMRLRREKEKTQEEIEKINSTLLIKLDELTQLKTKVTAEKESEINLRTACDNLTQEIENLEKEIQNKEQIRIAKNSQFNVLEDLSKTFEGFSSAVKAVMRKRQENPEVFSGVHDLVVNLIDVRPGFETCVESVLSEYLQAVIVEDKNTALKLKDYLDTQQIGRVRFIALDSLTELTNNSQATVKINPLKDFVKCDEKYKKVVAYLLNNVFLLPEKENVVNLMEGLDFCTRLVAREGELYSRAEMLTRPTQEQGLGLISQKAQMKKLKEEYEEMETIIVQLKEDEKVKTEQHKKMAAELSELSELLHQETITLSNKDAEKINIEEAKKKLDDELSLLNLEIAETEQNKIEFEEEETKGKSRLKELEGNSLKNEQVLLCAQELIKVKTQEREELLVIIAEMRTEFSLLHEQEVTLNTNHSVLTQSLQEQRTNIKEYEQQKQEALRRSQELLQEIVRLQQDNQKIQEEKQKLETQLQEISAKRQSLTSEFDEIQDRIKAKDELLNQKKNLLRDLEVKSVELNYKIETLVNNIHQAYKIELANLVMELPQDIDWTKQESEISVLKNKLERLGPVNLAAMEEEEELKERANFLSSQKEDLQSAKESLMQAIQKINKTTRSLFMDTFENTKVAFKEYFRLLFGGGEAQLHLSDEKDVLESGVEIIVRPPGKKLQNITLLSGGEKTLTAIALLFAIFKVKPTPFCVMDEMDAPLDEANVDRFTRVLQEFVKTSQFIIITHNKKTIGMADVMYGVTMEEPGVSKLVSVKFSEYKEESSDRQAPFVSQEEAVEQKQRQEQAVN